MSLLVIRHGFMVMTLKPKNSPNTEESCFALPQENMIRVLMSERNAAFFFSQGIMHYEFAPLGQTINQDFYLVILRCLQDVVQRKLPEMWTVGSDKSSCSCSIVNYIILGKVFNPCSSTIHLFI
jgi:hypothetical protein